MTEPEYKEITLERAFESINFIEEVLLEHSKNLTDLIQHTHFLTEQILKHRLTEFKKPPRNMQAMLSQLEPLEGMARYTLDAVNRLLPLQEKLETHIASKTRVSKYG